MCHNEGTAAQQLGCALQLRSSNISNGDRNYSLTGFLRPTIDELGSPLYIWEVPHSNICQQTSFTGVFWWFTSVPPRKW